MRPGACRGSASPWRCSRSSGSRSRCSRRPCRRRSPRSRRPRRPTAPEPPIGDIPILGDPVRDLTVWYSDRVRDANRAALDNLRGQLLTPIDPLHDTVDPDPVRPDGADHDPAADLRRADPRLPDHGQPDERRDGVRGALGRAPVRRGGDARDPRHLPRVGDQRSSWRRSMRRWSGVALPASAVGGSGGLAVDRRRVRGAPAGRLRPPGRRRAPTTGTAARGSRRGCSPGS